MAKVLSAAVMGAAIFLMHYTGMLAASFIPSAVLPDISHAVSVSALGLSGIVIGTLVVQGVAIVTSSVDRRLAEQAQELQTSERFRQIAENLQVALVLANANFSELLFVNRTYQDIWGRTLESFYGEPMSFLEGIHPEDHARVAECVQRLIGGEQIDNLECRVVRPDRSISWVVCRGYPIRDAQGRVYRLVGSARDITKRKKVEEELRNLSGQFLHLQDEERRKIAQDLHDSTGQNLVALATMLGQLRSSAPSDGRKSRTIISECSGLVEQCVREVRTLSYALYPPELDHSGLEGAIRDYVKGFTERSGIQVELQISPGLGKIERNIELALFRVVQESLTNIQRHSGSQLAKIRIDHDSNVTMEVSDLGRGAPAGVQERKEEGPFKVGVGILSMHERVKLIGGRLDIDSTARGTTVRVTVPLGGEEHEKAAHSDR